MIPKIVKKTDSGIVTNKPTMDVVWSIGRNVRFKPGALYKDLGKTLLATVPGGLPIREMFTFKGHDGTFRTVVCCDTKIFSYTNNFTAYTDITPDPAPNSNANDVWQFSLIGGMLVLTNGKDAIWKWDDFSGTLTVLNDLLCKALTTAMNRLILGAVQEGAGDYPGRVLWSGVMKPDSLSKDLKGYSGGKDLIPPSTGRDAIDEVKAFGHKGKDLIVYANRNIWIGTPADHPLDYSFDILEPGIGLIAPRCAPANYIMGAEEFYPIGLDSGPFGFNIWNSVFPNLNKNYLNTAFGFYRPSTKELYYCAPTGSNSTPDTAFVYQLQTKAWTFLDCNYLCHTFAYDETGYTWDALPFGSWDTMDDSRWDDLSKTGVIPYEVVGNASGQILKLDSGNNDNGSPIVGYIESGDFVMDNPFVNKIVDAVMPMMKPQADKVPLLIQVGARKSLQEDISWTPPRPFKGWERDVCTFRKQGKFIRFRFYTSEKDTPWIMESYGYRYTKGASR